MIEFLRIRHLGIIDEAQIELRAGLTVITGETGAGKTMVLSALSLLLGGKTASGLAAAKDTAVQGGWRIPPKSDVVREMTDSGVQVVDGELLVNRTMPLEGRSRCSINGTVVTASSMAEWAHDLVAVHGQAEQGMLRRPSRQRTVLDRFAAAELGAVKGQYEELFALVRDIDDEYAEATRNHAQQLTELTLLTEQLKLIEKTAPLAGEDTQLAESAARLGNMSELQTGAATALTSVSGDELRDGAGADGAVADLHRARQAIEAVADLDPGLAAIAAQLKEASVLLNEVGIDLSRYLADLDAQPGELERVQGRRAELATLTRQFGHTIDEVLAWSQRSAARVLELTRASDLTALGTRRAELRVELGVLAGLLSDARRKAATRFCGLVTTELQGLAMPHSELQIDIRHRGTHAPDDGLVVPGLEAPVAFGASGIDEVEFMLKAHASADPAPVAHAASGGELSRIMLALEVVLADSASALTFIFDEVDAGVGGKAAVEIGRRLARLSRNAQILVVTHLPQVAAFADNHLVVSKQHDGHVTSAGVEDLDEELRVRELARMLAGQEESEHAAAHAHELLDLAAHERARHAQAK
ncbi:MAG: DNA repair protein RecN (Recombination protein N) [Actinomycetes bacterium]